MILRVSSGLMSRCITLYDAYCLCMDKKDKLTIIWPIYSGCNIHFSDVFSDKAFPNLCYKVLERDEYTIDSLFGIKENIREGAFLEALKKTINRIKIRICEIPDKIWMLASKLRGIYIDYNPPNGVWSGESYRQHCISVRELFRNKWSKNSNVFVNAYCGITENHEFDNTIQNVIIFKDKFYKEAERIVGGDNVNKAVGVHIRRTDHASAIDNSKTDYFIEKMSEIIAKEPERLFFIATDDINEERTLRDKFADKILTMPSKTWNRSSRDGIEAGIIDMLCLSKCEYILGSYSSVFSYFSAWYGRISLYVCSDSNDEIWIKV